MKAKGAKAGHTAATRAKTTKARTAKAKPAKASVAKKASAAKARAAKAGDNTVSRTQAEEAVRTLIRWAGDDPAREGLRDTPRRVADAQQEFFSGYQVDPTTLLGRTFNETNGYDEMIVLRNIDFVSHCEHHMVPIIGRAHVGYLPDRRVVGISKLARVVEIFARRLQIQEKMTAQIADAIEDALKPRGVGVVIEAVHQCMTTRGIAKTRVSMVTSRMTGTFRTDNKTRLEFENLISMRPSQG